MRDLLFAIAKLMAPYILPVGMAKNFDVNESSTIERRAMIISPQPVGSLLTILEWKCQ